MEIINKFFEKLFHEDSPSEIMANGGMPPTLQKQNELIESYKFSDLLPYESYDSENGIFYNEDGYGVIIEAMPASGINEDTLNILSGLLAQDLKPGTNLEINLYCSPDIIEYLKEWANVRQEGHKQNEKDTLRNTSIYNILARKRVEYFMSGNWKSLMSGENVRIANYRLFVSLNRPFTNAGKISSKEKEELIRDSEGIKSSLRSADFYNQQMDDVNFIDLMDTILNPKHHKRNRLTLQKDQLLRKQIVAPDTLYAVGRDGICIETSDLLLDVRTYTIRNYPDAWGGWGLVDLIGSFEKDNLRFPCPFLVKLNLNYLEQTAAQNDALINSTRATQMIGSEIGKYVASWKDKKREWGFVQKKLDDGDSMCETYYSITTFSPNDNADAAEKILFNVYKNKGFQLSRLRFIPVSAFIYQLPFSIGKKHWEEIKKYQLSRKFLSWTAANIAPWVGEWKGTGSPFLQLIARRHQLSNIDPWEDSQSNYNVSVAAKSGSGKSFLTQEVVLSILGNGGYVWAFDSGRSYQNICSFVGGTFISFGPSSGICLNPFTNIHSWEGDEEQGSERIMMIDLVCQMCLPSDDKTLETHEITWIEQALEETWNKFGHDAEMTHVYQYLKRTGHFKKFDYGTEKFDSRKSDLADALYSFTMHGKYGIYFSGAANVDIEDRFVVLEMRELDSMPHLQSVVLLLLMMRITQSLYTSPRNVRKLCLIDEAWRLMAQGKAGNFIMEGYRTARKYKGSFMTITQGVNDYYKSETALAAWNNSEMTILLEQKEESLRQLSSSNRLPGGEESIGILSSMKTVKGKYSDMAVITGGGMSVCRLIVDPFSEKLYSTKGDEFEFIQNEVKNGRTLEQAVDQLSKGSKR